MPTIICPGCGRKISNAAPSCPKCGKIFYQAEEPEAISDDIRTIVRLVRPLILVTMAVAVLIVVLRYVVFSDAGIPKPSGVYGSLSLSLEFDKRTITWRYIRGDTFVRKYKMTDKKDAAGRYIINCKYDNGAQVGLCYDPELDVVYTAGVTFRKFEVKGPEGLYKRSDGVSLVFAGGMFTVRYVAVSMVEDGRPYELTGEKDSRGGYIIGYMPENLTDGREVAMCYNPWLDIVYMGYQPENVYKKVE